MCSEISAKAANVQTPSCYYYVNVSEVGHWHRSWADMLKYGFVSAGGGRKYSNGLDKLKVGHEIFAYQKGNGYVGYGRVTSPKELAADFYLPDGKGHLLAQELEQPELRHHSDNRDLAEYVVGVEWLDARPSRDAVKVHRDFTRRSVACRILKPDLEEFLTSTFRVAGR